MKVLFIIVVCILLLYLFLIAPRMVGRVDRTPFLNRHYAHRGLFQPEAGIPENSQSPHTGRRNRRTRWKARSSSAVDSTLSTPDPEWNDDIWF